MLTGEENALDTRIQLQLLLLSAPGGDDGGCISLMTVTRRVWNRSGLSGHPCETETLAEENARTELWSCCFYSILCTHTHTPTEQVSFKSVHVQDTVCNHRVGPLTFP